MACHLLPLIGPSTCHKPWFFSCPWRKKLQPTALPIFFPLKSSDVILWTLPSTKYGKCRIISAGLSSDNFVLYSRQKRQNWGGPGGGDLCPNSHFERFVAQLILIEAPAQVSRLFFPVHWGNHSKSNINRKADSVGINWFVGISSFNAD